MLTQYAQYDVLNVMRFVVAALALTIVVVIVIVIESQRDFFNLLLLRLNKYENEFSNKENIVRSNSETHYISSIQLQRKNNINLQSRPFG